MLFRSPESRNRVVEMGLLDDVGLSIRQLNSLDEEGGAKWGWEERVCELERSEWFRMTEMVMMKLMREETE